MLTESGALALTSAAGFDECLAALIGLGADEREPRFAVGGPGAFITPAKALTPLTIWIGS